MLEISAAREEYLNARAMINQTEHTKTPATKFNAKITPINVATPLQDSRSIPNS